MKFYRYLVAALCVAISHFSFGQELPYAWLKSIQPIQVQSAPPGVFPVYTVTDTHVDASGNVYTTGFFSYSCDFDPGSGQNMLVAFGAQDIFVAKYSPQGQLLFVEQVQGNINTRGIKVRLSASGKVIVSGRYESFLVFDPYNTAVPLSAEGQGDIFVARFDGTTGAFETALSIGSFGEDVVSEMSVVGDQIILAGSFSGAVDFDPFAGESILVGGLNTTGFMMKLNSMTSFAWAKQLPAYAVNSLKADANGIYAVGNFSGTIDLDPGAGNITATSNGVRDGFATKFDNNGNVVWAKSFGGSGTEYIFDMAIDASGNLYIGGGFTGSIDLDPSGATTGGNALDTNGDAFISKLDASGNFVWGKIFGGTGYEDATSLITMANNRLIVSGNYYQVATDLDPTAGTKSIPNNGGYDVYISYFSTDGTFIDGFGYGGDHPSDFDGALLATNGGENFIAYGSFSQSVDFDPSSDVNGLADNIQQGYITYYGFLDTVPAGQPTSLNLTPASGSVAGSFTAAASGPDGYIVVRKLGGGQMPAPKDGRVYLPGDVIGEGVVVQAGTATTFNDILLAANKSYGYAVYSYNNSGSNINYRVATPLQNMVNTGALTFTRQTDSLALVALYNATNGPSWTDRANWLSGPLNTWSGVVLSSNRVYSIDKYGDGLSGKLPSIIANLSELRYFYLGDNSLPGSIAPEIFQLVNLIALGLEDCGLTGSLSGEISNLVNLTSLNLRDNSLSGAIPTELASLPNIQDISLYNNQLSGSIPSSITSISTLTGLYLSNNKLTGTLPTSWSSNLRWLHLSANQLTGSIPSQLAGLSLLNELYIEDNQLTGSIPNGFENTSLQELYLRANQLTGSIPAGIGQISTLVELNLESNNLTGVVPSTFTSLSSLTTLVLSYNKLSQLPNLSALPLTTFSVDNNNFTFEDLEPNISKLTVYAPQSTVGTTQTININAGATLNLGYNIGGSANSYKWQRNTVDVAGETLDTLIRVVTAADAGAWRIVTTNSLVPALTITSVPTVVVVRAEGMFEWASAGDLTNDGKDANMYSGVWSDYDNDGFEDIYTLGTSDSLRTYLYKNNGNGTFSRVTTAFEFSDGRSAVWGDYNNDGFADIFIPDAGFSTSMTDGISAVFRNNGNGTFTKISLNRTSISGAWVDIDFDGDLDLSTEGASGSKTIIYRNDGGDIFTPLAPLEFGTQWNGVWVDVDNNNKLDYYVPSTYQNPNEHKILFNEGSDLYDGFALGSALPGQPIGGTWADIDNDGDYDLFSIIAGQESRFYINDGDGVFQELLSSAICGEVVTALRGATFGDLNNDGYTDLLVARSAGSTPLGWTVYLNTGSGTFSRVLNQTFKLSDYRSGASLADYDNDGDLDIFSPSFIANVTNGLYRNVGNSNKWMKIKLQGTVSNRWAIGAKIDVYAGGLRRHQQVITANGFGNQNPVLAHFGMASATMADSVEITWPTGRKQKFVGLAVNQVHTFVEPTNPTFNGDATLVTARQIQSADADSRSSLGTIGILDPQNNSYIVGEFNGTIDLDPGAGVFNLTAPLKDANGDNANIFIAKYSPNGDFLWAKHIAMTPGNFMYTSNLKLDNANNLIIAGEFAGSIDMDPSAASTIINSPFNGSSYNYQGFLAKYDNNGNFVWVKEFEATGDYTYTWISDVVVNKSNDVVVSGMLWSGPTGGSIDVDPGAGAVLINSVGSSTSDAFVAKYTFEGNYVWHVPFASSDEDEVVGLAVDDSLFVYTAHTRWNDPNTTLNLSRYSTGGTLNWTAASTTTAEIGDAALFIDKGSLYVLGAADGNFTLNGKSGSAPVTGTAVEEGNPFLAKLTLKGAMQWAKSFPSTGFARLFSLSSTNSGDLILSGMFEGSLDMDPGAAQYERFFGGQSTAVVRLNPSGDFVWGFGIDNSFAAHQLNTSGEMILGMVIESTTDIDPNPSVFNVTPTGRENILWLKFNINEFNGISASDSLSLKAFYDATGGPNWTNRSNWLQGKINTWFGVSVVNNEVTAINLPNNNLVGSVPVDLVNLSQLITLNIANNKIESVANLSTIPTLTNLNVSGNRLTFSSLEYNMPVDNFLYTNQAPVGSAEEVLVDVGDPYTVQKTVGGTANQYQWMRNNVNINGATSNAYTIAAVNKATMGDYVLKVTNTLVPDLMLTTQPAVVLATAKLNGRLMVAANDPATTGTVTLLKVVEGSAFEKTKEVEVNNDGTYEFEKVVLNKYQIVGFADTLEYEGALPTYYNNKLYWEEADTLEVEGDVSGLDIVSYFEPEEEPVGNGLIDGYVVEDDEEGGRSQAPKRVKGAGASVRRVATTGRGKEEVLTLISYVFTNDEGEFEFPNLPEGQYRLNIQYPGYPMDPNSFITITIGANLEGQKRVEASVEEGKIVVRELVVTGIEGDEAYQISAFPNPASSLITLAFANEEPSRSIELLDVSGRILYQDKATATEKQLNVSNLNFGVYFIKVNEGGALRKTLRVEIK